MVHVVSVIPGLLDTNKEVINSYVSYVLMSKTEKSHFVKMYIPAFENCVFTWGSTT